MKGVDNPQRTVVVALFPQVDLLDVTGPAEVFSLLQREMETPTGYHVLLAAHSLAPVVTSAGVRVLPDITFEQLGGQVIDTLIVPGAVEVDQSRQVRAVTDPVVVDWVRQVAPRVRRVASVCVGAHTLAQAGLLDGKRATTHWSTAAQLAAQYPAVTVDAEPIFIRQDNIWTGAGLSACLDLALALVADDFGEELALRVARQLVMYLKRPSGQSQFSVPLSTPSPTRRIEKIRVYITQHLTHSLTVTELAEQFFLSERQLTRIFQTELGTTPARYVEVARVEAARNQLETTKTPLPQVAAACGLGSTDTLIRAFRRVLNTTPAEYRKRFQRLA